MVEADRGEAVGDLTGTICAILERSVYVACLRNGVTDGPARIERREGILKHHPDIEPQIAFKPDWTKHAKAAPFKRNDQMLDVLPIGVMHFPGTGIQDNLADKARKLGIPVWKFGGA
jgi:hypothetical protein